MYEGSTSTSALLLAAVLCLTLDVLLYRRRPFAWAVGFIQLTFTFTVTGAAWLAETERGLVAILVLGAITKLMAQALFAFAARDLVELARRRFEPVVGAHLYVAVSLLVLPLYALLAARGGLAWFRVSDLRADYTAENSTLLRAVRHWTPVLFVWGLTILRRSPDAGSSPPPRTALRSALALFMATQLLAFALLEGSKSASLLFFVMVAGAAQLLGYRVPKRLALPAVVASVALLGYLLTMVAAEWSASLPETFAIRMVSGSQGLLFAIEPPGGKYCPLETFWFPVANFLSKVVNQTALTGYGSMGHCLGAPDPSVPWELLVPLLAAAYHVDPWLVPVMLVVYLAFAAGLFKALVWTCRAVGEEDLAFPVSILILWDLLATTTHGKWLNLMVSDVPSILALIAVVAGVRRAFLGRSAHAIPPPDAWPGESERAPPGGTA